MKSSEIISTSPEHTHAIARDIINDMPSVSVIALHGNLGAGKTCLVQGIALALEIKQPVTSPTFKIINEYQGIRSLYHMDLYRLTNSDDVLALGFEEYLESGGIIAIEWPDRASDILPANTLHIHMSTLPDANHRRINIETGKLA